MADELIPHLFEPNVKQRFLPFSLDPTKGINSEADMSSNDEAEGIPPQLFTFRTGTTAEKIGFKGAVGLLGVFPSSFKKYFNKDVSYRMLYESNAKNDAKSKSKVTLANFLDSIPGILIREYLPDSRLDLLINFINWIFNGVSLAATSAIKYGAYEEGLKLAASEIEKKAKSVAATVETALSSSKDLAPWILEYVFFTTKPGHGQYPAGKSLAATAFTTEKYQFSLYANDGDTGFASSKTMMLNIPYLIYYKLQSCTTTNIYEIPFYNESKSMYSSNGTSGWSGASGFAGQLVDAAKGLLGMVLPGVSINYAPWYNAMAGGSTPEDGVVVTFDLFNDNYQQAMTNFIFVNTIIPLNRWLQYGFFGHSPCLYDIKVEGMKRLYMCTGEFKVTCGGVFRSPTKEWIKRLCSLYANKCLTATVSKALAAARKAQNDAYDNSAFFVDEEENEDLQKIQKELDAKAEELQLKSDAANEKLISLFVDNGTIRIPDVYHVELTFKSLLPSNFNTFIMSYAENEDHIKTYANKGRENSIVMTKVNDVLNEIKGIISGSGSQGGKSTSAVNGKKD